MRASRARAAEGVARERRNARAGEIKKVRVAGALQRPAAHLAVVGGEQAHAGIDLPNVRKDGVLRLAVDKGQARGDVGALHVRRREDGGAGARRPGRLRDAAEVGPRAESRLRRRKDVHAVGVGVFGTVYLANYKVSFVVIFIIIANILRIFSDRTEQFKLLPRFPRKTQPIQ